MYRAFRIINNQYGGCVVYIHDVSIHNASELTFAKTGNCPNVSHISHCVICIEGNNQNVWCETGKFGCGTSNRLSQPPEPILSLLKHIFIFQHNMSPVHWVDCPIIFPLDAVNDTCFLEPGVRVGSPLSNFQLHSGNQFIFMFSPAVTFCVCPPPLIPPPHPPPPPPHPPPPPPLLSSW